MSQQSNDETASQQSSEQGKFTLFSSFDDLLQETYKICGCPSETRKILDKGRLAEVEWGRRTGIIATMSTYPRPKALFGIGVSLYRKSGTALAFSFSMGPVGYPEIHEASIPIGHAQFDAAQVIAAFPLAGRCSILTDWRLLDSRLSWLIESCLSKAHDCPGRMHVLKRSATLDATREFGPWVLLSTARSLSQELSNLGAELKHDEHVPRLELMAAREWCPEPNSLGHIIHSDHPEYVLTIAMTPRGEHYVAAAELWHIRDEKVTIGAKLRRPHQNSSTERASHIRAGQQAEPDRRYPRYSIRLESFMDDLRAIIENSAVSKDIIDVFSGMPKEMEDLIIDQGADISARNVIVAKAFGHESGFESVAKLKQADDSAWTVGTPFPTEEPSVFDF